MGSANTSYCINCGPSDLIGFNLFEKEMLDTHNEYRRQHGSPALYLDRGLCNSAQRAACSMINTDSKHHKMNPDYGENIYMCHGNFAGARQVVERWYKESEHYKFGLTNFSMETCHFTQLVWHKSTKLGVGFSSKYLLTLIIFSENCYF